MFRTGIGKTRLYIGMIRSLKLLYAQALNQLETVAFNGVDAVYFLGLFRENHCTVFFETGTHIGATTSFMANAGIEVYTTEVDPIYRAFAKFNLTPYKTCLLLNEGSLQNLLDILALTIYPHNVRPFFYLDAHNGGETPLAEELAAIEALPAYVCVVDDYKDYRQIMPIPNEVKNNKAIFIKG